MLMKTIISLKLMNFPVLCQLNKIQRWQRG